MFPINLVGFNEQKNLICSLPSYGEPGQTAFWQIPGCILSVNYLGIFTSKASHYEYHPQNSCLSVDKGYLNFKEKIYSPRQPINFPSSLLH